MKISILGPSGSYTEKAAHQIFSGLPGGTFEFIYQSAIESVVLDLFKDASEKADFAVIPVENSIEGAVGISMDLLLEKDMTVAAEVVLPISHCLLLPVKTAQNPSFSLEDITCVYSHSQGLYQCRSFIRDQLKNACCAETESTSKAALFVSNEANKTDNICAAIASAEAGEKYGLAVVKTNIQDNAANFTRFFILKRSDAEMPSEAQPLFLKDNFSKLEDGNFYLKTSVVFSPTNDKPGALFHILEAFYRHQINLTRIESRPSKKALGEYYFYIDLEGTPDDQSVADALSKVADKSAKLKLLGTYGQFFSDSR
jgi:Prephenate dehydratase